MTEQPHYRLMIPGPVEVDPDLMGELTRPMTAHYGPEWTERFNEVRDGLRRIMLAPEARVFPVAGPGSAGLDAMIGSTVGDGKPILVAVNGFFGNRLRQIAARYLPADCVHVVSARLGEPVDPTAVEEALKTHPEIEAVALVHCETSCGVLNPLGEVAEVAASHGALTLVDAITSLGGAELRVDDWGLDVCVGSTQKALGLPPGLAPVCVSERAWSVIERTEAPGWYLNLRTWQQYVEEWGEWHPHPVTMPPRLVRTLHRALQRLQQEGIETAWARHERAASLMRQGLANLGFRLLPPPAYAAPTVTAAHLPEGVTANDLSEGLKRRHRIQIAGALGEMNAVRIGHMATSASPSRVLHTLLAIEDTLWALDHPVAAGQALQGLNWADEAAN